ncbi:NAD(P)-dependent oxidoreductase [Actinomadura opuntiae]|uniref:NAD(P)-dependent oxidoreductase n=1 Tax=Actinomadura sp. OS1-43 TaxID=604315 RepID=UPI00255AB814|nr:NAD(P)-binding domain-containing protein [Actinomadura sp. OS1-43]MDL4816342.1 NAD(P)-binding domain-containing protein [Actinomadura sp. OS1-43]
MLISLIETVNLERRPGRPGSEEAAMRIGFVGAGRMGRPMVERLAGAGHDVLVLGRSPAARASLEELGVRAVARAADAAEGADAVLVCVFSDEQVRDVCLGGDLLSGMPSGSVVVLHTTGSPDTAKAVADRAAAHGVGVIDCPVSGGPHDIAAGRLTLFAGGATADVATVRPALEAYGDPLVHVGELGAGQRVKLVNNALFAAQIGLLAHAVRLAEQLGVDEAALLAALPHASSASRALAGVAGRGSVAAFAQAVSGFLGKDVDVVRTIAAAQGADLGVLDGAIDALDEVLKPGGH